MKKNQLIFCMGLSAIALFTSCNEREFEPKLSEGSKEQGTLVLNLDASTDFDQTRALSESDYRNTQNYNVKVVNSSTNSVILECKASELSANLPKSVDAGTYRVEASYGTELDASRSTFRMYGEAYATVKVKEEKRINVNCTPTCGKVSVAFDSQMSTYYSDYSITFGGTQKLGSKTFAWSKTDSEPWYIALNENGERVSYTINLTTKDDYLPEGQTSNTGTVTGSFMLARNRAYKLSIKPNYVPGEDGSMTLSITIDERTNDKVFTWEVPVAWL